jgi:hypothetical protein
MLKPSRVTLYQSFETHHAAGSSVQAAMPKPSRATLCQSFVRHHAVGSSMQAAMPEPSRRVINQPLAPCHALHGPSRAAQGPKHLAVKPAQEPGVALSAQIEDVSNFFQSNEAIF